MSLRKLWAVAVDGRTQWRASGGVAALSRDAGDAPLAIPALRLSMTSAPGLAPLLASTL